MGQLFKTIDSSNVDYLCVSLFSLNDFIYNFVLLGCI